MPSQVTNITRRLLHHDRYCKMHTHEAYCSCGRDKALAELFALLENQNPTTPFGPPPRRRFRRGETAYTEPTVAQLRQRLAMKETRP